MVVEVGNGNQPGPARVVVDVSKEIRSPPAKSNEFDAVFGDRVPAQPPLTPDAQLDLMVSSSPLGHTAFQDRRYMLGSIDFSNTAPVVHLPNSTRDAALLDPQQGGVKRSPWLHRGMSPAQSSAAHVGPANIPKPSVVRGTPPRETPQRGPLCL